MNNSPTISPSPSPSSTRTDLMDVVIVSSRGAKAIQTILEAAAMAPERWGRHHFIILFDDENQTGELQSWFNEKQATMPMPRVTIQTSLEQNRNNLNSLRQEGLELGDNNYVYFQDDDSELPEHLRRRMKLLESGEYMAVYGVTETINSQGRRVELFPALHNDNFIIDPVEGSRWFPTFPHPLAALFKRELFSSFPIDDGNNYQRVGEGALLVRLTENKIPITFSNDIIRKIYKHRDNDPGILTAAISKMLVHDIKTWLEHIKNPEILEFHQDIAEQLENGDITTYREIDAMIEAAVESQ